MKKNLFCIWLVFAILFSVNTQAQMTIGGKKEPEAFSVLELLNKGGLRLPQMTTAERDAFAVKNNDKGNGLTIYNKTTNCVEYWNASRWVSLCDGTSQTTISPQPCINVAADGTGCDQTFNVTDPDCPNGPFTIAIMAGSEYASLYDIDKVNGKFKIYFNPNETVNTHTVLVRVTSTCTSLYKEFLFSQNGVDCTSMPYAVPVISPSSADLALCAGGAVYLSVPANTANLNKIIWTRNGLPIQGSNGASYIVATQKGEYNISMGAVGCNTNASNKRTITESGTVTPVNLAVTATNSGVICGTKKVTLSASGNGSASVVWFHNGKEEKTGESVEIEGDSSVGEWFAATKNGSCYSKPSSSIQVTKSQAAGEVSLDPNDVLVNDTPLQSFTNFCSGGSLNLAVKNQQSGITYKWYNGNDLITANPFIVPASQSTISLRMEATDNSGAKCAAEQRVLKADITQGSTPENPDIKTTSTLCNGKATLTVLNSGNYTYTWYKDKKIIDGETSNELQVTAGGTYGATIKNTTGCISPMVEKTISGNSSGPNLDWDPQVNPPTDQTFGSQITLTVTNSYDSSYTWTMDGIAVADADGKTATIFLPKSGTDGQKVKIAVKAKNECGEKTIEKEITMNIGCPTPVIASISSDQTIKAKTLVTINVSVNQTNTETYAWYQNTTNSTTGGAKVGSGTSYSTSDLTEGTYYFYCIVTNGCTGKPFATSLTTKVTVTKSPVDILPGTGSLSGRTCFDIVETAGKDCGTIASRSSQKADFTKVQAYTYTFTKSPTGTVNNLRFDYIETVGAGYIVKDFKDNGDYTVTVTYKSDLNTTARNLDSKNAYKLTIYAIFNDGTGERAVSITAQIKDCMCCGAKTGPADTDWKAFMCHNLGADTSLDPFIPARGLYGKYYQWGMKTPIADFTYISDYNTTAVVPQLPIKTQAAGWSIGSRNENTDPCPKGYRVPTKKEWEGVGNTAYNRRTPLGTYAAYGAEEGGMKFGDALMLPNAGFLESGGTMHIIKLAYNVADLIDAWGTNGGSYIFGWYPPNPSLFIFSGVQSSAISVRCIAE